MAFYEDPLQITFILTAIYIIICMFMVITVEKVMQSTYWLIMMLVGVAVTFLLANSEIIFAFQISIYAGGIAVLLLFAVLLTEHDDAPFPNTLSKFLRATWMQLIIFLVLAVNMIVLILDTVDKPDYLREAGGGTPNVLGDSRIPVYGDENVAGAFEITENYTLFLWDNFGPVIPFLGLLLLAALLGSVKLAIREWDIEELSDEMKAQILKSEAS
ncbi:MAG: NADH-quinone oxidoreductase subunit J [Candidatus Heimdallarchaeota archaeon]|nr:NADH-quinone oxidoreductase subunit J [Candidatus Heimdallarchaeota archaeon]